MSTAQPPSGKHLPESDRDLKPSSETNPTVKADAAVEELIRRIPLNEVLYEEYQTLNPPAAEPSPPGARGEELEKERIAVEDARVDFEKAQRDLRERCEKIADACQREREEKEGNDQLTRAFFTLLAKEQRFRAGEKFATLTTTMRGEENAVKDIFGVTKDQKARQEWEKKKGGGERAEKGEATAAAGKPPDGPTGGDTGGSGGGGGLQGNGGGGNGSGNGGAAGGDGRRRRTPDDARQAYARGLRSALCLSGGGIRSATFNLGIIQGLARHGLLEKFDYLSTVSGGGFIGGWLSGWLHRQADPKLRDPDPAGMDSSQVTDVHRVVAQLKRKAKSPLEPEPAPINHLRVYSNFLSPQTGLLSADTWTLVSTLLRNLLLTWLVFIPFLILVLMVPRVWGTFTATDVRVPGLLRTLTGADVMMPMLRWMFTTTGFDDDALALLWVGMVFVWIALSFVALALAWPRDVWPRKKHDPANGPAPYRSSEWPFLVFGLLPGVAAAVTFAGYWKRLTSKQTYDAGLGSFLLFSILLLVVPVVVTFLSRLFLRLTGKGEASSAGESMSKFLWRLGLAAVVIVLAQVVTGCLLYAVTGPLHSALKDSGIAYQILAVPIILAVLGLDCVLIAGFTSTLVKDEAMEWWARAGAWLMIAIVGWAVIHALVLYGPYLFLTLGGTIKLATEKGFWTPEMLKAAGQLVAVVGGLASLVITLVGGFSAKTPAHGEEAASPGIASKLLGVLAGLLGPLALAFLLILLAILTNYLLKGFGALLGGKDWPDWLVHSLPGTGLLPRLQTGLASFGDISATHHEALVATTPLPLLLLTALAVALVGLVMGLLINTNKFSLHYLWRNRIIRAYLGASNKSRSPDSFTNFDPDDNIQMHELRRERRPEDGGGGGEEGVVVEPGAAHRGEAPALPRKLFHVLNIALNLAGGDKLAWQDRKSESFTVSPLHCGSYWLGYRRSKVYGGENGVSLGTAIAISGAFVSPNMGYMMTSPVVRFLMTLFNARFGWWLGNPGPAGDKTYWVEGLISLLRRPFGRESGKPFEAASPALSVRPIVSEAFGKTDDRSPYVYLSDGGHFENLGLYEMVLRRCRFIVVSDASTDAGYSFDSLAQSIRQIRVDFGVPIDITQMSIIPPSDDMRGKYCAVGTIRYSCVDRDTNNPDHAGLTDEDFDGTLIYIKASMIGDEPRDVVNYGRGSSSFPQEIIVDQWFSEAQFESYRALGSHIIDSLCSVGLGHTNDSNQVSLAEFEDKARRHNQLHFGVFKERASYAALENEFRRIMRRETPGYSQRVKEYFESLVE